MTADPTVSSRAGNERRVQAMPVSTIEDAELSASSAADSGDVALPDQPFAEGAQDAIDPDLRHRLISETAYGHYIERGYAEGYDVDDWLLAEAEVDHLLLNPQSSEVSRLAR